MKVNKQNRDHIVDNYIEFLIEAMDTAQLIEHLRSSLEADYYHYTDEELQNEIEDNNPEFPWEDFEYIDE